MRPSLLAPALLALLASASGSSVAHAQSGPAANTTIILVRHAEKVNVVGHSNTVPGLVTAFGAAQPAEICDAGYDNVFVVTVPASGATSVARLHYGEKASCTP